MALEGKTDGDIRQLEEQLLARLREVDGRAGNVSLLRALGWEEDVYWELRDRLVNRGLLELGRGRGGSVRLIEPARDGALQHQPQVPAPPPREAALYDPIARVLRESWVKDNRFGDYWVEVTARQGARDTGGTWTRPDITVAGITTLPYLPGKTFDVVTFEVKGSDAVDVTAIYEALAHLRAATRAYVIFHIPDEQREALEEWLERPVDEAKRHGVGVIVVSRADDYDTWDELVEARRHIPDPGALNDFVAAQLPAGAKTEIANRVR